MKRPPHTDLSAEEPALKRVLLGTDSMDVELASDTPSQNSVQQVIDDLMDLDVGGSTQDKDQTSRILQEIEHYQSTTHKLIPRAAISRVCKDILCGLDPELCFDRRALRALHVSAEDYLVRLFDATRKMAEHANRSGITVKDLRLAAEYVTC
jgi:histone H3/H4